MKVYEFVKKVNTKVSVKLTDVMEVKKYYLSLYRANMVMMYDKGYISDPTIFNTKELFKNIVDMNIQYLTGVTGKIELSEDYLGFAIAKYKGSDKTKIADYDYIVDFLSLLLEVVKYRNLSMNVDKFTNDCDLILGNRKKVSISMVQAASKIYFKTGFGLDESILKCLYGKDNHYEFVSLNDWVYSVALKELGLEDLLEGEDSLFVKGLTRSEEIKYSNIILNGLVALDGQYANKLVKWLKRNKWAENNKFTSQKEGLYNWVLFIQSNDTIEEQSRLLNSLLDNGKEVVGMKSEGFYVLSESKTIKMPTGVFVVVSDNDEDEILPDINRLEGYTGEVYSLHFLNKNEISYVGCPIELFDNNCKKCLYMDKEQTDMKDSVSWFADSNSNISFDENFDLPRLGQGTVAYKLQDALIRSERGELVVDFDCEDYKNITDSIKKEVAKTLI